MPKVLNKYTATKEELDNAVYCGRGSPWGNPFKMTYTHWQLKEKERHRVCDKFEKEILPTLDVSMLRGKNLLCFCAPKRCHCDSILRKANLLN